MESKKNNAALGFLYLFLGLLSLAWFGYEVLGYAARGGVRPGESVVMEYGLTGLKLIMVISFFIGAVNAFRNKG